MNLRKQLRDSIGGIIIATLLGCSLALTLTDVMGMPVQLMQAIVPCAVTALICTVMTLGVWPMVIALAAVLIGGGAAVYLKLPAYTAVSGLITALLSDGALAGHSAAIGGILGVMLTATAFLMTRIRGGVYPALIMLILVALGTSLFQHQLNMYYIAPALIAIAMLFASSTREKTSFNSALPIALTAVFVAMALMPQLGGVSDSLQRFGRSVRTTIGDYLMFSEARTLYSVQSDGYQSNSGRMGGDANPSDFPIMEVETDRTLLLRGAIKREYTGSIWIDSAVNSRNLFVSPLRRSLRNQVFGLDLPAGDALAAAPEGLIDTADIDVRYLSRGTSTLFTPHRMTHMTTGDDMIAYFNSAGEVFITRTVRKDDSYSFTAQLPDGDSDAMGAYLSSLSGAGRPSTLEAYLTLPEGIDTRVYDLTYQIIGGGAAPYDKARAIEDYLKNNYSYTLTPGDTPEGSDFVSHFLLEGKRGYCTYFASAMGVMARIAGIPSRYVEGYLVKPEEDGVTEVIGKNAHAWVELYFEGFGWLSFDPTPDEDDGIDAPPPDETEPPRETPTPTPEPTPEPTVNVPPDATVPPSMPPEEVPEEEPTEPPLPDDGSDEPFDPTLLIVSLIMLLLALLIAFIVIRLMWSTPHHALLTAHSPADRLMVYYRAVLTVLAMQGQVPLSGETPSAFAERLTAEKLAPPSFTAFTDAVVRSRYAGMNVTSEMYASGVTAYADVVRSLNAREKLRWYRRRIRHGMGNVKQIP